MRFFARKFFVVLSLIVGLSGCSFLQTNHGSDYDFAELSEKLSSKGVSIDSSDNKTSLLIPNKDFFVKGSANFAKGAYKTLDLVLAFSNYFEDSSLVAITGYFHNRYNAEIAKSIAFSRAERVMGYLWDAGMDATFVRADGEDKLLGCVSVEFIGS